MKRIAKIILGAVGLTVVVGVGSLVLFAWWFVHPVVVQTRAGRTYMNSLNEKDIQQWVDRSKLYLINYVPRAHPTNSVPIPPELKALKIVRIYVWKDTVWYLWVGGLDHTALEVKRLHDDAFEVTAIYSDEESKVIWRTESSNNIIRLPLVTPPTNGESS